MKTNLKGIFTLLLAFVVHLTFAQEKTISGTVSDQDGLPLPGVNILVVGTSNGTQTDFDGNYTIKADTGTTILFSYVGQKDNKVVVGSSSTINIQMTEDAEALEEVVVTALGIKKAEKSIGYAVQNVKGDDIAQSREANLVNALSGKVAGVQITNSSGAAGASSRIVLRGASSITGNNQPLFIIDGIPIDNSNQGDADAFGGIDLPNGAADINPDDIASVSVLKGPNAAAIYGLRASNGVIVITTKRGTKGKALGVTISSSVSFENPLLLPSFQNSYGQGNVTNNFDWIDGTNGNGGVDESWGPPTDVGLEFVQWNSYTVDGAPLPWVSQPNNVKDFYQTGVSLNNNVSLSGGSEKSSFRLSFSGFDQKGMVPFTDFKRYTVGGNFTHELSSAISAGLNVRYIKSGSDNVVTQGYSNDNPTQQINGFAGRNVDFSALQDWRNLPLAAVGTNAEGTPINWNTVYQNNVYWQLETNTNAFNKDRVIGGANVSVNLTDKLTVTGRTGIDYWTSNVTVKRAQGSNADPEGRFSLDTQSRYEINSEALFSYSTEINDDFDLSLNVGGNSLVRTFDRVQMEAPQLELPGIYNINNVKSGITPVISNYTSEQRINSVYGFGQLGYKNMLFLDFTARNDWASILPVNNNSFFYPSATLSAALNDIFKMPKDKVSLLKLRGGWAQVGSTGVLDPYQLQPVYQFSDTPFGSTSLAFFPSSLNNPNIGPETTTSIEAGIDLRLFKNRLRFDATYYDSTSEDLIVDVLVSGSSGITSTIQNIGELNNKGIEIQLGGTLVRTDNLSVDLDLNFGKNNNKVVSLGDNLETLVIGSQWNVNTEARVGLPYGSLFGPAFERSPDGEVVYVNGLPQIADENKVLGDIQPDWTGGANLTVNYKNFSFGALVDAKIGGDIYSITNTWGRYGGILEETLIGRETGVVGDGVKLNSEGVYVPNDVVVSAKQYNQNAFSNSIAESSVFDASYVKLRQVSVGYSIPSKMLSNTPLQSLTFSVVGRNLAILHKNAPHIDPESAFSDSNASQGLESGQIPSARSVGFNINAKF
ncbi:SusC/RagA family TonB-linked outer membrane protein [Cellulophaga sp. HaHaR_3_176]|uniref:SusC/RagA family TonB-linked outer membrane protein n=1 Tax=Cellulophaga sp. HaHaR_3_176 TaxID=1942464 RepID=UPI001C1F3D05|nr:SusC/RagA family TonB-linked outer membrane protein [Cellulophaga sp. HaHaR_3_176]QWX82944.1 SusC/RagA family TonB-linked outer membrane protein [Cellulophaga sp. HaHaR_3_176]